MIAPHEEGWIDERWGRIVIGIGRGDGKYVLAEIIHEVCQAQFDAGVQHEVDRRTREIAEKLLGTNRTCAKCDAVFEPRNLLDGPYYCDNCDIPF